MKGDEMFIIEEGTVVCTKNQGGMEVNVSPELGSGKFFGELALLNDQPRAASVKALSAVSALAIDRATSSACSGRCRTSSRRHRRITKCAC